MREERGKRGRNIGRAGGERGNIGGRAVERGGADLLHCALTLFC